VGGEPELLEVGCVLDDHFVDLEEIAALVAFVFVAAVPVAIVGGTKIKTIPDKTFSFAGLKTIDWLPEGRGKLQLQVTTGEKPADLMARFSPVIEQEVERAFPARGFTKPASGTPDLYVHYYILISLGASAGFLALLAIGIWLEIRARLRAPAATATRSLAAAMRTTPGRVAVLSWWVWLGTHFLAR
jgi:hypothetical protein